MKLDLKVHQGFRVEVPQLDTKNVPPMGRTVQAKTYKKDQVRLPFIVFEVRCLSATLRRLYHLLH